VAKFTDEEKAVKEFNDNNFKFGVHKVAIMQFDLTEKGNKECVEVSITGENGEEDTAVVWLSTPAARNYTFNVLRGIYVHNAPEEAKDAARDSFDAVEDPEAMVKLLNEKLIGAECWFTKFYDPTRKYLNGKGEERRSVNKNVYGYEPKERPDLMPRGESDDAPAEHELLAGAEPVGAGGIPKSW
jgi:hypothetical protein